MWCSLHVAGFVVVVAAVADEDGAVVADGRTVADSREWRPSLSHPQCV